jgi:hypothetical protein
MHWTDIINISGDYENEIEAQENWKKTMLGGVSLYCPKCFEWFKLDKDFKIDKQGFVTPTIYHVCDNEELADNDGWIVNAHLVGWSK